MHGLHAIAWRGLRARPLRTLLTITGVALGVAVLSAGLVTNRGIESAVDRAVATRSGQADLRVTAFGETGLPSTTVEAIRRTDGVAVAAPTFEQRTYLGLELFAPGDELPPPVTVVGIEPAMESRLHDLSLEQGSGLAGADSRSALVSATLAREDGLVLGSELTVQGPDAPMTFRVVGILAAEGPWTGATGRAVLVPLASAHEVFGSEGLTRIDIGLADEATTAQVSERLEATLLDAPYVLSSPQDLAASMRASTGDFAATTGLIAAIALFAGAFLIFNTLSMTVVERLRELGLLRAAGATRGQITTFILAQAFVIAAIGSVIGVVLGSLLAAGMSVWVRTIGAVPLGPPVLTAADVLAALGIGLVVTVAAAIEPARRAASISPVEALKSRSDALGARRARLRWLVAVFAVVGVVGLLAWPRGAGDIALIRSLIVYGALLGVVLVVPILLPALARVAGAPYAVLARVEERIARASILRDRARATLTVGALTVGLAMIVALGGLGQHARAVASAWVADVVPGDLVVTSIFPRPAEEGLDALLADLPGAATVSPIASFDLAIDGRRTDATAMSGAALAADGRLQFVAGDRPAALAAIDAGGAVIVPASVADRDDVTVGDILVATAADGSALELRVAGITERTLPGPTGESLLVGWPDAEALSVAGADAFAVRFDPSSTLSERTAFADEARALALEPSPVGRIQGAIGDALDRVFGLFDALALVAVVVAALGVVNTLSMNVLERVREIGVLRAAGMTRAQVWRSVVVEAGITGLLGAMCGIAAGIVLGGLMVILAGGRVVDLGNLAWPAILTALVLGVVLAVLAAAYPARLASRVSIIRAVGYE
jgi:putative ABC transport system permease protein